jgi:hypothetical protein
VEESIFTCIRYNCVWTPNIDLYFSAVLGPCLPPLSSWLA